jgi:hypothetical protein
MPTATASPPAAVAPAQGHIPANVKPTTQHTVTATMGLLNKFISIPSIRAQNTPEQKKNPNHRHPATIQGSSLANPILLFSIKFN